MAAGNEKRGEKYRVQPFAEGRGQILPITLEESPIWPELKVILYLQPSQDLPWRQWSKALNTAIINQLKEAIFAAALARGHSILTKINFKLLGETEGTNCHRHDFTDSFHRAC